MWSYRLLNIVTYAEESERRSFTKGCVSDFIVLNGSFGSKWHVFKECIQMPSRHSFRQLINLRMFVIILSFSIKTQKLSIFSEYHFTNKLKKHNFASVKRLTNNIGQIERFVYKRSKYTHFDHFFQKAYLTFLMRFVARNDKIYYNPPIRLLNINQKII